MHLPGVEPGSPAWQAEILPLDHRCFGENLGVEITHVEEHAVDLAAALDSQKRQER